MPAQIIIIRGQDLVNKYTNTQTHRHNLSLLKKLSEKKRWRIKYMNKLTNRRKEFKIKLLIKSSVNSFQ